MSNASASCTDVDHMMKRYYLPVMYAAIFIVGVLGNATALVVYVLKVRPWTSNTVVMVNLLLTDLLLMGSLPLLVRYYALDDTWTLGAQMCRFTRFTFHFNLYGSILFLTCLAVFRYVAVVRPLQRENVKKKRWGVLACALVWTAVVLIIAPIANLFELKTEKGKIVCPDLASSEKDFVPAYSWVMTALGYVTPLAVVCLCYWRIMRVLAKGPYTGSAKRTRARRVIVLILTCFVVCFLPFHVLRALRIYTKRLACTLQRGVHAAYVISRPVAVLNVVFNMTLYTLTGDSFKQAFLELFRCKKVTEKTKHVFNINTVASLNSKLKFSFHDKEPTIIAFRRYSRSKRPDV